MTSSQGRGVGSREQREDNKYIDGALRWATTVPTNNLHSFIYIIDFFSPTYLVKKGFSGSKNINNLDKFKKMKNLLNFRGSIGSLFYENSLQYLTFF
ncbi:hypothetical protein [Nostoc sp. CCY0012]|uniref:hypothetical protein n=1 Tax=Nostoc sp. CCY0012 TaxID=1056123 RepID=UPI0039C6763C